MKWTHAVACGAVLATQFCSAAQGRLEEASQLEVQGRFKEAAALLDRALAGTSVSPGERRQLAFERDRLDRIRKDFPLTKEALFDALQKSLKDLTADEFERWLREGRFDSREFDGARRFMVSSVSNLYWRHPELNARRLEPKDTAKHDRAVFDSCLAIQRAARAEQKPYALPKRFHVTMTVTADADAAPASEPVRCWLPVPRGYPFQTGFKLLTTSSPVKHLDAETSPIRSVQLEQPAQQGKPTEFRIEYEYTAFGVSFDVKPDQVLAGDSSDPALAPFLQEEPHVVFTPEIRALSQRIAGSEKNPCLKAKRFYDWIAENIQYSYSIEYCTIRNISDYCRSRGYGDCGQEALLFMTLCRLNGIPARWQSGWNTFPTGKSIHDWCEIYLAPYGWIPVDPYKGIWAMRYAFTLTPEQKRVARDFYFGGLDQYRMAANSDHCQELTPPKRALRSDTVDFQRGELEWGDHNLYFDKFSYELNLKELK
jgi:transglutaminase-like putative cysteine protease